MVDLVRPRVFAQPKAFASLGDEAVAFSRRVGLGLDPEQELVLRAMLGTREDGRWQALEVGINAPRQNGKGEILMARELFGAFVLRERNLVHSAHEFRTSRKHFARVENAIRDCDELFLRVKRAERSNRVIGFRYSHGEESIELEDGCTIEFKTRTRSGMRGFDDVSCLVLDEAMIFAEDAHGSMLPTVRASSAERGPQIIYAGSAADQAAHPNAVVWARVRERGIAGDDPGLVYAEWSLDFEHPDEVPDDVMHDPEMWERVNWAIARGRVRLDHMAAELRSLGRRQFIIELLGVGDWPATDSSPDLLITPEQWAAQEDRTAVLVDPVCIAFDITADRCTSIVAAGASDTGKLQVEVINSRAGTGWVAERLRELYESHYVAELLCDGMGPSVAVARRVEELGIPVRRVNASEYAEACGLLVDRVIENEVVHLGQEELDIAVRGARSRPLVDRWAWSRTKSVGDVGPLVAASLALWSVVDTGVASRDVVIY